MKRDLEVHRMLRERAKGRTQEHAAARTGMSVRTAGAYERLGQLPSQRKQPRTYRTRPNPFEDDWPWVVSQLERDDALQATTLFACWTRSTLVATRQGNCALFSSTSPGGAPSTVRPMRSSSPRPICRGSMPSRTSPTWLR